MTPERIAELERDGKGLTPAEIAAGWHFCWDWDQMLVGPATPEWSGCQCGRREHVERARGHRSYPHA